MPSKAASGSVRRKGRKAAKAKPIKSTKAGGKEQSADRLQGRFKRQAAELAEARAQQTATAEILGVLAESPADVQPVLDAVVKAATRFCGAEDAAIGLCVDDELVVSAHEGPIPHIVGRRDKLDRSTAGQVSVLDARTVHIPDILAAEATELTKTRQLGREFGYRAIVAVPMMQKGRAIGTLFLRRALPGPFAGRQIALLQTFAAQAVIAIENTRLINETKEALERQTATADILKVIASSPSDLQPVFQAIAERSNRLVNALSTGVYSIDGDVVDLMAFTSTSAAADALLKSLFPAKLSGPVRAPARAAILAGEAFTIPDSEDPAVRERLRNLARQRGWRSSLYVPLMRDNRAIGLISVNRPEPGEFAKHQVELLRTFANQAVIAIENARLFNETREALQRQTATADILKVIAGSPADLQPVFEAIVQAGLNLFPSSAVMLVLANEGVVRAAAIAEKDAKLAEMLQRAFPVPLTSDYMHTAAISDSRLIDIPDAEAGPDEFPAGRQAFLSTGHRAITIMPMMRGDHSIGALSVVRRLPGPLWNASRNCSKRSQTRP